MFESKCMLITQHLHLHSLPCTFAGGCHGRADGDGKVELTLEQGLKVTANFHNHKLTCSCTRYLICSIANDFRR